MNNQQAFDLAVAHLATQKKPALDEYWNGRYITQEGAMCAVGVLLKPSEYKEEFEGLTALDIRDKCPSLRSLDGILLGRLQVIHDTWAAEYLVYRLSDLAKDYNLNTDVLDNLDWSFLPYSGRR